MSAELANAMIALMSAILGWVIGTRTERTAKKQYQLDAISFASSWYTDLRAWASEAIEILSEATERCGNNETESSTQNREALLMCRARLSALIDRGRFFLPNEYHEEFGVHKPEAYRGFRHPALDYLVGAYQILEDTVPVEQFGFDDRRGALVDLKRQFASAVQSVLNPRLHIQEINRLVDASRSENLEAESPLAKFLNNRIRARV